MVIVIFAFMVLGGFYLIFDKLSGLEAEVRNAELNYQLASSKTVAPETPGPAATSTANEGNPPVQNPPAEDQAGDGIVVPTGIIFTVISSPALQPQTSVTVTIEKIVKKADGTVIIQLKAFTSQATSYSAVDPGEFIQIVSLDSDNQRPVNASAIFNSMPPKSVSTGTATFKTEPGNDTIIIQTGQGDNLNFYEINFAKKTYKETIIG